MCIVILYAEGHPSGEKIDIKECWESQHWEAEAGEWREFKAKLAT